MLVPLKDVPKTKYESFEDAWTVKSESQGKEQTSLAVSLLLPFPEHRFQLYEGERKAQMVDSIKEFGVLLPLIVWHTPEDTYVVLSGHNRLSAAKEAGLAQVPVLVRGDLTLDEAILIVTETNLRQRSFSDLSHSERAFCLAQHYHASKQQGKRSDLMKQIASLLPDAGGDSQAVLTSAHSEQKSTSERVEEIQSSPTDESKKENTRHAQARATGISSATFARYVKIAELHPRLLALLDQGKLSFLAGYQLSFLGAKEEALADRIENGFTLSQKMAKLLRDDYEKTGLSHFQEILAGDEASKKEVQQRLNKGLAGVRNLVTRRIPAEDYEKIETILEEALDLYFQREQEQK